MSMPDWTDRKKAESELVTCDKAFNISWYIAAVFLLLGFVSDAARVTLVLQATHWYLLVLAALLAAIIFRLGAAIALYIVSTKRG